LKNKDIEEIEDLDFISIDGQNEGELYEHHRFVVDKGQNLLRVDKFLTDRIQNASRTKIQAASEAGCIQVNSVAVKSNYKVKPDDVITVMMAQPPREIEIIPEDIPLDIVYEDDELMVVNKPAGMVVHPSYGHYRQTLINALAWHLKGNPLFDSSGDEADPRPGLVHRIDKDTSGLLVVAKTEFAKAQIGKQFADHKAARKYVALVWGNFEDEVGTITGNIGRSLRNRKVMDVFSDETIGKPAVTHYRVLERLGYVTLVECILETGRTHQIRAHMQHIGHPIFNDSTYGGDQIIKGTTFTKYKQFIQNCFKIIPRQALHAKSLGLTHPVSGGDLYFETELPADMQQIIEKWRGYISNRVLYED
jgi:23S rRNA pseudouridine1911/1915/1917 synthase